MQRALRAAQRTAVVPAEAPVAVAESALLGRRSEPTVMLGSALRASSAHARRRALAIVAALLALAVAVLLATHGRRPAAIPAAPRPTTAEPALPSVPAVVLDASPAARAPAAADGTRAAPAAGEAGRGALPGGVSEPDAMQAPAGTRSLGAGTPKSKRLAGRRRYDRVTNDIVDPWE
jgi:hypothetical protein